MTRSAKVGEDVNISDLHGSLTALEQVLAQLAPWQPDHYLLLGDLLNHGPRNPVPAGYDPAAVAARLNQLAPRIMAVRGNCDSEVDQMLLHFPITAPYNQLLVDGRRWFVSHGHLYEPSNVPLPAREPVHQRSYPCACTMSGRRDDPDEPGGYLFSKGRVGGQ